MTQEEFHKRYQYNPNTDCLGEGGFGKVFKAYDTHRDRWVAIKMAEVKPQLEEVRLKREVEMIKKLPTHPNIAYYEECYTFSTFAGEYDFGILQYYELGNLQQLLTANQLTDGQKDSLLRQILEGIGFLHSQGIIHRDIKPQNILIVNRNGEYVPKITDFGISKKLDTNKSSVFTNSLAGAGTLSYASPEQLCGLTIKKNTDLWSFGIIVYWLFLGKLPFNTGDMTITSEAGRIELFKQITKGEIPGLVNQLNSPWNETVKQCLVANNEKRLANASECSLILDEKTVIQKEANEIVKKPIPKSKTNATKVETDQRKTVIANNDQGWGFVNKDGVVVIPLKYDSVGYFSKGIVRVELNKKYGYINKEGIELIPCKHESIDHRIDGFFETKSHGKFGLIDKKGVEITIPFKYDHIGMFHDGLAQVLSKDKWGFIDQGGVEVISCELNTFSKNFSDGLASVRIGKKFGFINTQGIEVIPFKYQSARSFSEGLAMVRKNNWLKGSRCGFIDKKGNEVIQFKYFNAKDFSEGLAAVEIEGKWGFINKDGERVSQFRYDSVDNYSEGFARVKVNDKYGIINRIGEEVISCKYDELWGFSEGLTPVKIAKQWGFVDQKGVEQIALKYNRVESFSEGLAKVKSDTHYYGFVNQSGIEVIPCKYNEAEGFSEGLTGVRQGLKWGFIDKEGQMIIPFLYDDAKGFSEGLAAVKLN